MKNKPIVEIFKDVYINGEKSKYIISDYGRCINTITGVEVTPWVGKKGKRVYLSLYHKNISHTKQLARWIALSFLDLPFGDDYSIFDADHIDGDPFNNILENIQWLTKHDNSQKSLLLAGHSRQGEGCPTSKLKEITVREIHKTKKDGVRFTDISTKFNVHPTTLHDILTGKTWKYVYDEVYNIEYNESSTTIENDDMYDETKYYVIDIH